MPPSFVPENQIENYKIIYITICKNHLQNQRKQNKEKKKTKNPKLKFKSHLGPELELRVSLHSP